MSSKQTTAQKEVSTHLATQAVSGFLLNFFISVFLPILPSLLLAAAPQISTPKFQAVLKKVDDVIDQLIGETP